MVPLKEREKETVARLAEVDDGSDVYGNTTDAKVAMGSEV